MRIQVLNRRNLLKAAGAGVVASNMSAGGYAFSACIGTRAGS